MAKGRLRAAAEMDSRRRLRPGNSKVKASAVMPPMEAPTRLCTVWMPKLSSTAAPVLAISSKERIGKSRR